MVGNSVYRKLPLKANKPIVSTTCSLGMWISAQIRVSLYLLPAIKLTNNPEIHQQPVSHEHASQIKQQP